MEKEREEVYERIPWETLENKGGDRQWMVYVVAGAVTLGALAYSFTRNQPATAVPTTAVQVVAATTIPQVSAPEVTVASPIVVTEADLYAIDPERVIDQVAAHAEWFAVEYISYDGTERSRETLEGLLPIGVPAPEAPDGTQVFVDWARTTLVTQTDSVSYDVEVLVRSLVSTDDSAFARQPARRLTVGVEVGEDGSPRVSRVPEVTGARSGARADVSLTTVPEDVVSRVDPSAGEVLGGIQDADGSWQVVVVTTGADGVSRATLLRP
ncbi:MAG: hypothetical protein PVG83_11875 [Acidimicrobiia bacterium]|jgi:hypothetical protein